MGPDYVGLGVGGFGALIFYGMVILSSQGAFTRLRVMAGVRGYIYCGQFQEYDVEEDGVICRSTNDTSYNQRFCSMLHFYKIRVLAYMMDLSESSTHKSMQSRSIGN